MLVDDMISSGTTLAACTRLPKVGAAQVEAVVTYAFAEALRGQGWI